MTLLLKVPAARRMRLRVAFSSDWAAMYPHRQNEISSFSTFKPNEVAISNLATLKSSPAQMAWELIETGRPRRWTDNKMQNQRSWLVYRTRPRGLRLKTINRCRGIALWGSSRNLRGVTKHVGP